ncbi:SGNH/GDSL hydrolase family protein [Methylobacterium nonmethylotrophicum]|uniref:DUF459 domain-containing protein n=1 Tax=Methylobacterium nonmethylotrophicum TaxID=1141884 RepID=A0A4Z0NT78_9HYPH|nr:GDSL-type esterase/lipase family protein [Methylobacterium nonmethylotrophicum]TGE00618.1 DUF459 domain-containing protein [Methylobacterium nonmethylotrophicum]
METDQLSRRAVMGGLASLVCAGAGPARAVAAESPGEIRIAFVGDSLSDGMWGGVTRLAAREACLGGRVKLGRFAENGTGLTRPAKFDWVSESKAVVAKFKPTLSVVSIGLNDRQSIVDASRARFDLGTPAWRTRYTELCQAMARNLRAGEAGVVWIGLPVLRDAAAQDDAAEKNAIFAEAVKGLGDPKVRFVAPWRLGSAGPDAFQPYGPDLRGAQVQLRAADGIHFTTAGYDVVSAYLLAAVAGVLKEQGHAIGTPCRMQQAHR